MVPKVCSIPECKRPARGRGWCGTHWLRWRKYGDPLYLKPRKPASRCSIDSCDRVMQAHGYCSSHLYHLERYGDPLAVGPGKAVGRKRMDVPSYDGMHKRLFYDRGKASDYSCVECGNRADEWSYDGGCPNEILEIRAIDPLPYTTDQTKYSPRCIKCHRAMDGSSIRGRSKDGRFAAGPVMH